MRICDINNLYSPTGGGIRRYHTEKLAYYRALDDHPYALMVPGERWKRTVDGCTITYEIPSIPLGSSGYRLIVSPRGVRRALRDFSPDIVELGSVYVLPLLCRLADPGRSSLRVGFYHADYPETYVRPLTEALGRSVSRAATRLAALHMGRQYRSMDAVFAASRHSLGRLSGAGVRRLFHTPLGVDTARFSPAFRSRRFRAACGASSRRKLVLFHARLAPEKGIHELLEAYPSFRDPERVQLVIGGHGPSERAVAELVRRFPEVNRLPYLDSPKALARAYASADLYLSLGGNETFSLSTLEAMACGTPVLTSRDGGAAELVRGAPGCSAVDTGDPEAVARAIRKRLGDGSADRRAVRSHVVGRYAWKRTFDTMTEIYASLTHDRRRGVDVDPRRIHAAAYRAE